MQGFLPWLLAIPLCAQPSSMELLERKTIAEIQKFDEGFTGVLGVAAIDLETGRAFGYNADSVFPQASVIKIPILIGMFQAQHEGRLRLSDSIKLDPAESVGGSGHLQFALRKGPVTLTLRELIAAMMHDSDNTATNKCISLAGMDYINRSVTAAGARETRLQRKMMDPAAALRNEENISTPNDMAHLMEGLYRGAIVDRAASEEMIGIMKGLRAGISEGVPLDIETASKDGQLPGARGETGIVWLTGRPFVLSVMSAFIDDRRTPVPEVTRIVFRHFERLAGSKRYGNRLR